MTEPTQSIASPLFEVDGRPATVETLAPALGGYGHFTAMQVRGGGVRGLDFHLTRLDGGTRELFGAGLDGERVREQVRHALATWWERSGSADASVRVNVFQPDGPDAAPALLVTVRPPGAAPAGPMRLKSVPYQRPVAHLKHVGGFAQTYYGRRVAADGYDEALLVGPGGEIAEGSITNICFLRGGTVVWPDAPQLRGVTLQVLERELDRAGVPQTSRRVRLADIGPYDGAFLANSRGVAVIAEIDGTSVRTDRELLARVRELYDSAPWDAI